MTTITQDELKSLLTYDPDTGDFQWRKTYSPRAIEGRVAGSLNNDGYCQIQLRGVKYKAHRLVWLYVHGVWPPHEVDHVNRARNDNRLANLRPATHAENGQNQSVPKNNRSGVIGVGYHKRDSCWRARIRRDGKLYELGRYETFEEAAAARRQAELNMLPFRSQDANDPVLT